MLSGNFISVSDAIMHYEPYLNLKKQIYRGVSLQTGKNSEIEGSRLPGCRGVSLQTRNNSEIEGGRAPARRGVSLQTEKNPEIEGCRLPGCRGVSLQTGKNSGIEGGRPLPFIIFTEKE